MKIGTIDNMLKTWALTRLEFIYTSLYMLIKLNLNWLQFINVNQTEPKLNVKPSARLYIYTLIKSNLNSSRIKNTSGKEPNYWSIPQPAKFSLTIDQLRTARTMSKILQLIYQH